MTFPDFLFYVALIGPIQIRIVIALFLPPFIHLIWMLVVRLNVQFSFNIGHNCWLLPPLIHILNVVNESSGWCQKVRCSFTADREDCLLDDGFWNLNRRRNCTSGVLSSLVVRMVLHCDAFGFWELLWRPRLPKSLSLINAPNCSLKLPRASPFSL